MTKTESLLPDLLGVEVEKIEEINKLTFPNPCNSNS